MPRRLEDILPASGVLLGMEPEELAGFLLEYLSELPKNDQYFNFASLTLGSGPLAEYAGNRFAQVADAVAEAWSWLMREGLIAPRPGIHEWGRFFVTRRGRRFKAHADLEAYRRAGLLHEELLDGGLASKIVPAFQRGEYDTAVFAAFKEVEIRVRAKGGYSHGEIGTDLMKKAFHPETGPLTDKTREAAERQSMMFLFTGAIGLFKNPSSHRAVEFRASEAAALIHFANYLVALVEGNVTPS